MLNSKGLLSPKYRADIDGLRAIAILSVVGFHTFPNVVPGGFVGVDIFFVISGFLISTIIFSSLECHRFSLIEFYTKRIKRIFPALCIVLIACLLFGWLMLFPEEYKQLGKHIAAGTVFFSNFLLSIEAGYFDVAAETKPLLHLWSLAIEEQFYIVWPLLIAVSWKIRLNLLWVIIVAAIISFVFNIDKMNHNVINAFYYPASRFWELLLGSYLAYLKMSEEAHQANNKKIKSIILSFAGLFLMIGSIFLITKEHKFPGWLALFPTIGVAFIIFADSQTWLNRKLLANPVLVWFGLISFPLYLWHWPLLSLAKILEGRALSEWMRILIVTISVLLAFLTYQLIEKPIRFSVNRTRALFIFVPGLMVIGMVGFAVHTSDGYKYRPAYIEALMSRAASEQLGFWKYMLPDKRCLKRYPFDTSGYGHWFCLKETDNEPTILLLGSSYMNQNYPGFLKNEKLKHHTILSIGTCAVGTYKGFGAPNYPCYKDRVEKQRVFIDNIIATTKSLKLKVVSTILKRYPLKNGRQLQRAYNG